MPTRCGTKRRPPCHSEKYISTWWHQSQSPLETDRASDSGEIEISHIFRKTETWLGCIRGTCTLLRYGLTISGNNVRTLSSPFRPYFRRNVGPDEENQKTTHVCLLAPVSIALKNLLRGRPAAKLRFSYGSVSLSIVFQMTCAASNSGGRFEGDVKW